MVRNYISNSIQNLIPIPQYQGCSNKNQFLGYMSLVHVLGFNAKIAGVIILFL